MIHWDTNTYIELLQILVKQSTSTNEELEFATEILTHFGADELIFLKPRLFTVATTAGFCEMVLLTNVILSFFAFAMINPTNLPEICLCF